MRIELTNQLETMLLATQHPEMMVEAVGSSRVYYHARCALVDGQLNRTVAWFVEHTRIRVVLTDEAAANARCEVCEKYPR